MYASSAHQFISSTIQSSEISTPFPSACVRGSCRILLRCAAPIDSTFAPAWARSPLICGFRSSLPRPPRADDLTRLFTLSSAARDALRFACAPDSATRVGRVRSCR